MASLTIDPARVMMLTVLLDGRLAA